MNCKKCGQLLLKNMKFCPNCEKSKEPTKLQLSKLHDFFERNQLNLGFAYSKENHFVQQQIIH